MRSILLTYYCVQDSIINYNHTVKLKSLSHVRLLVTPWNVAYQALPSVGFSRQEYWSGLSCPPSGDLPDPGIKPLSLNVSCIGRWVV